MSWRVIMCNNIPLYLQRLDRRGQNKKERKKKKEKKKEIAKSLIF
jgi:hypothetical protein